MSLTGSADWTKTLFVCSNSGCLFLKGTKRQHIGQISRNVRKMGKSLFEHLCYCLMLFMRTTKTAVCLQTTPLWVLMGVLA